MANRMNMRAAGLVALFLLLTPTAWSAPAPSEVDTLWNSVVEAYQKVTSFRMVAKSDLARGGLHAEQQTVTIFSRPNLVWWHARGDTAEGRIEMYIINDGEKLYRCRSKQARVSAAPTSLSSLASFGFGDDRIILMLLDGNGAAVLKQYKVDKLHYHGRMEKEDKTVCQVIGLGSRHRDQETRFWVDPKTHLITRIDTKMRARGQDFVVTMDLEYTSMGARFDKSQFGLPPGYETEKGQ